MIWKTDRETLTTDEAGKLCAVDSRTILNWVKSGKLKSYQTAGGFKKIIKSSGFGAGSFSDFSGPRIFFIEFVCRCGSRTSIRW